MLKTHLNFIIVIIIIVIISYNAVHIWLIYMPHFSS